MNRYSCSVGAYRQYSLHITSKCGEMAGWWGLLGGWPLLFWAVFCAYIQFGFFDLSNLFVFFITQIDLSPFPWNLPRHFLGWQLVIAYSLGWIKSLVLCVRLGALVFYSMNSLIISMLFYHWFNLFLIMTPTKILLVIVIVASLLIVVLAIQLTGEVSDSAPSTELQEAMPALQQ